MMTAVALLIPVVAFERRATPTGSTAPTPTTSGSATSSCAHDPLIRSFYADQDGKEIPDSTPGAYFYQEYKTSTGVVYASLTPPGEPLADQGCPSTLRRTSYPNLTWAGRVVFASDGVPTGNVNSVYGTFTEPIFVSYCTNASSRAIWVGIGGNSALHPLMQTGSSITNSTSVTGFYEIVAGNGTDVVNVDVTTPIIYQGDALAFKTSYSGGTARFDLWNNTSGISYTYFVFNQSANYDGSTGEWTSERATPIGGYTPMELMKSTGDTLWYGETVNGYWPGGFDYNVNWMTNTGNSIPPFYSLMVSTLPTTSRSTDSWRACS
jgi:peptidase A4-like protein